MQEDATTPRPETPKPAPDGLANGGQLEAEVAHAAGAVNGLKHGAPVIVTKDGFGCQVWEAGTELVCKVPDFDGRPDGANAEAAWLPVKWRPFHSPRIFSSRQVAELFPKLGETMSNGESKAAILALM